MAKLSIPADALNFHSGVELIIAETSKTGLDMSTLTKIKLQCGEIFLNIIKESYAGVQGTIDISSSIKNHEYIIEIRDHGKPFNALSGKKVKESKTMASTTALSDFSTLFKGVFDSAEYRRENDTNVIVLRKMLM
jgi:anti-sigma regulatory factor (Ser/Thr protein kinase)